VERCIRVIFSSNAAPEALTGFVKVVHAETLRPGLAPSNAFVLVHWCSILLQEMSGTALWDKWGLETIASSAQALELCLSESSRSSVRHSALVVTRRGLRKVFSMSDSQQKLIEDAVEKLSSKDTRPSAKNAIMLGVIAGVCARNLPARDILAGKKTSVYGFYVREIIGSRSPLPAHIANGLHDFFVSFTSREDVEKEIVPSLEKALLRAPEIVLNDLVSPLFRSLPDSVDLSIVLKKSLLEPLLSNIKSTNATIRLGALSTFKAAVLNCHEIDVIAQIADTILAPLKAGKLSSVEQRVCHAEMLAALPISKATSTMLGPALSAVAGKEANETALAAVTLALLHCVEWGVQEGMIFDKSVVDALVNGISDKRAPFRKLWTLRLGQLFWSTSNGEILKSKFSSLAESSVPVLSEIWNEVTTNPLSAAQSGLVSAAYVFTAISQDRLASISNPKVEATLKKAQVAQQALTMDPKPSFLLNQRIYGKLTSEDDFRWFIRALSSLFQHLSNLEPDSETAVGWSQAIIFCVCSSTIPPEFRREATLELSRLYVHNPVQVSSVIVAGIWRWRHSVESGEKDSAAAIAKTDIQHLHLVVKSICLPSADIARLGAEVEESVRQNQMISMLVLARPQLLPRVNWIDLSLRIEVDPGNLARTFEGALVKQILDSTDFKETVTNHIYSIPPGSLTFN
jgi:Generalcontrol nonderepressible 1 (Gcn1) N-terminal